MKNNMGKYILKRLAVSGVIFIGITAIVYVLMSLTPGTPLDMLLDPNSSASMTPEELAELEAKMGLDKPVAVQYFYWLKELLQGNFGTSYRTHRPVIEMIGGRIGPTLMLSCSSLILALAVAVPLGMLAGYRPYTKKDYCVTVFAFIGQAAPNFFVGMILIYIFSIKLGWLPSSGMYDNGAETGSTLMLLKHMCLPCVALAVQHLGIYTRQMRSSMLECLSDDYIRTARAKGMSEGVVLFKHALRNSLLPLVTSVGMGLGNLVGGAIVTEQVFGWPGMGTLMVNSILMRDYPTIMGITVFVSLFVLIGGIVVDILYRVLDPRIG